MSAMCERASFLRTGEAIKRAQNPSAPARNQTAYQPCRWLADFDGAPGVIRTPDLLVRRRAGTRNQGFTPVSICLVGHYNLSFRNVACRLHVVLTSPARRARFMTAKSGLRKEGKGTCVPSTCSAV